MTCFQILQATLLSHYTVRAENLYLWDAESHRNQKDKNYASVTPEVLLWSRI